MARCAACSVAEGCDVDCQTCCLHSLLPALPVQHPSRTCREGQMLLHGLGLTCTTVLPWCMLAAGSGTVKVYYYGWWVLTASGSMCDAPPAVQQAYRGHFASSATSISTAHRRSLLRSSQDSTSWSTATWITSSTQPQQELSLPAAAGSSAASPAHHLWGPVQDDTCVLPTGPLKLYHQATLPGIAPRGNYRMQLSAADVNNGMELFCLDVWFKVA